MFLAQNVTKHGGCRDVVVFFRTNAAHSMYWLLQKLAATPRSQAIYFTVSDGTRAPKFGGFGEPQFGRHLGVLAPSTLSPSVEFKSVIPKYNLWNWHDQLGCINVYR